ncbi:MAG: hydroxyacylglutathione hydrolase [Bdellovibrionaceae bacterium]|jgi:hydroxyacylglutathione hydrolase|nr:hydroxyacylglutathione hydrolase [Pseudobdellovibrionaceae bacterium]
MIKIHQLEAFTDNYIFILQDTNKDKICAIDPGDANIVIEYLNENHMKLDYIFNTHHHWDHVDGNEKLKDFYGCKIYGSENDKLRIPFISDSVKHKDVLPFSDAQAFLTTGHTSGHLSYYFKNQSLLFCGDTLFSYGCGRIFDGSAEDLFNSIQWIKSLPLDTMIYCTHEYTLANLDFALSLSPNNQTLLDAKNATQSLLSQNNFTIPFQLGEQLHSNPFLNCNNLTDFVTLRKSKDNF